VGSVVLVCSGAFWRVVVGSDGVLWVLVGSGGLWGFMDTEIFSEEVSGGSWCVLVVVSVLSETINLFTKCFW
jgi:hypothetical protein